MTDNIFKLLILLGVGLPVDDMAFVNFGHKIDINESKIKLTDEDIEFLIKYLDIEIKHTIFKKKYYRISIKEEFKKLLTKIHN